MNHDNAKTLKDGLTKGMRMIEQSFRDSLHYAAVELIHRALQSKGYVGFTGNTQTSYACGIYVNGNLVEAVSAQNDMEAPVRHKIRNGKTVFLKHPYEGVPRARTGAVDVDGKYGAETSLSFLNNYHAPRGRICIVMTTGTEYSEYLESVHNLNVLTLTWLDAAKVLEKNWRKIAD